MSKYHIVNETHERLKTLVAERLPWLVIGLIGGTIASFIVSRFEAILVENISLAFFVPMIVYMAGAVGTQTETIFVRDLADHRANYKKYLKKEILLGMALGIILGLLIAVLAFLWLRDMQVAFTVGLAMFINIMLAPVVAIIVPELLFKEHTDPALGAGPFTTVIQDILSLLIYFLVAAVVIWHGII